MGKSLEPIMTRTIRINADYLSETTIAKYINPVVSGEGTIELPPESFLTLAKIILLC